MFFSALRCGVSLFLVSPCAGGRSAGQSLEFGTFGYVLEAFPRPGVAAGVAGSPGGAGGVGRCSWSRLGRAFLVPVVWGPSPLVGGFVRCMSHILHNTLEFSRDSILRHLWTFVFSGVTITTVDTYLHFYFSCGSFPF